MTNLEQAVHHILNNNLIEGKKIIHSALYEKMGKLLEEKLIQFAPTVFNEELKGKQHKLDADGDGKLEGSDFAALRKKKKHKKKMNEEDEKDEDEEEDEEDMNESLTEEEMQELLSQLIEEIEEEAGQELTEQEIQQVVEKFLQEFSN